MTNQKYLLIEMALATVQCAVVAWLTVLASRQSGHHSGRTPRQGDSNDLQ